MFARHIDWTAEDVSVNRFLDFLLLPRSMGKRCLTRAGIENLVEMMSEIFENFKIVIELRVTFSNYFQVHFRGFLAILFLTS